VAEAAVVAAPDARLGEHAAAVLRLAPGRPVPSLEQVRAHFEAAGLARPKWPEEVHAVDDFPRTASGKVQKFVLRADIAARQNRE
jgi:non-ribosomal peptide synthetase component E (peptide arylation enzyme)